ncbi:MAG: hypothetical protein PVI27_12685, partial [Desulfobacteraceae bacterium]
PFIGDELSDSPESGSLFGVIDIEQCIDSSGPVSEHLLEFIGGGYQADGSLFSLQPLFPEPGIHETELDDRIRVPVPVCAKKIQNPVDVFFEPQTAGFSERKRFFVRCLNGDVQLVERMPQEAFSDRSSKSAAVGRQSHMDPFPPGKIENLEKIRMQGRFSHDMKRDFFAKMLAADLSDQPFCQVGGHVAVGSCHLGFGAEAAVEITHVGQLDVDALERDQDMAEGLFFHGKVWLLTA